MTSERAEPVRRGRLLVVSGPSGVGKGTVVRALLERRPNARLSVSVTTRPPRDGEVHGVHYHFVDAGTFDRLVADGELLEWAPYLGDRYGTPRRWVEEQRDAGYDVVLEIDVQGARLVRERVADALLVFLAPPTWEELERRLASRGTEPAGERRARLDAAREELAASEWFNHRLVNDDLETCVDAVGRLLDSG